MYELIIGNAKRIFGGNKITSATPVLTLAPGLARLYFRLFTDSC